jgi:hypothetical protein
MSTIKFKITNQGTFVEPKSTDSQSISNRSMFCCTIVNSNGQLKIRRTIEADGYFDAIQKCSDLGDPGDTGQVGKGECENAAFLVYNVRNFIAVSINGRLDISESMIDSWVKEIEEYYQLERNHTEIIDLNSLHKETSDYTLILQNFNRWECIKCVSLNISLAASITAAIAVFGPASPVVVSFIAAKFGISEVIAALAVGGVKGAALAKRLCGSVC